MEIGREWWSFRLNFKAFARLLVCILLHETVAKRFYIVIPVQAGRMTSWKGF